ncbi:hypothetical protein APY04_3396 [Hyphomicrobium sulfonivorans]|uniref:DUF4159 domain-containing protein n=1 Tax=Hyphomicrobium sulfonivorans TaxID=121290 RepID=A0A109B8W7_HYPSL|nr:DUF4159 domain-containing protein [Hyphomicrobium sulfonivorans]KWT64132.1 hypothetical protein APY04_3396 [Hyphomicrobium sulfonivorans]
MSLGALTFLSPWLLASLAALPIIYWLLRTVPPSPRQVTFPPTRILVGLENKDKTPAASPWWLTLIRLLAAALFIFALADPVMNPTREAALKGTGPIAIVVDNGWSSAAHWDQRKRMIDRLITDAEGQSRAVVIVPTAPTSKGATAQIEAPSDARSTAAALMPQPFAPDRLAAANTLAAAVEGAAGGTSVVWLSDDIDHDGNAAAAAAKLRELATDGTLAVVEDGGNREPLGLNAGIGIQSGRLEARILRPNGDGTRDGFVHAISTRGQSLAEASFRFLPGQTELVVPFDLPLELRNQIGRVEIAGERAAGAVSLIDARSQWHRVALISGESREQAQPLLAPLYYIEKALAPSAELIRPKGSNLVAGIQEALSQNASVLMLADIGTLSGDAAHHVADWVEKGGVLVRFAGPRLENGGDELLPVPLRLGGRTLGGALSWSTPQKLGPIENQSPFAGLTVPPEVTVNRQVLADPAMLGPDVQVWARLEDGTPLVTERKLGQGRIILFHVTANTDWSNLPLSGLFVEMLRRIAALGTSVASGDASGSVTADNAVATAADMPAVLPPLQTLNGYGVLGPPPPTAQPVAAEKAHDLVPTLDHPPGYYGAGNAPRAINVLHTDSSLAPLPPLPSGTDRLNYSSESSQPLKPWLLLAALGLLFADMIAVILLRAGGFGGVRRRTQRPAGAALALAVIGAGAMLTVAPPQAFAQTSGASPAGAAVPRPQNPSVNQATDERAIEATAKVTLGYVLTGNAEVDEISRVGLDGLGRLLSVRTAIEPGRPLGINILTDEIAFYPVIYWPVLPDAQALPEDVLAKIDAYMKQGGLIVFDTRDYGLGLTGTGGPSEAALKRITGKLDMPRLEPVPENHVLTKAFYLLRNFPGRWDGGQLWVEALDNDDGPSRRARISDGVTSIIVTANDLASAWALDESGRPLYPTVGGGENQREMAFRTGVNIVMHALTGNYKADQVHVPALLERLGQ